MTSQEQALVALAAALESARVPYMVIGGQANAIWGLPRATIDIDVTVWLADRDPAELVEALAPGFVPLVQDAGGFARQTSVVPLQTPAGLRIDVILGRVDSTPDPPCLDASGPPRSAWTTPGAQSLLLP